MAEDTARLDQIDSGDAFPTLRFFRWSQPTVSYGRLQRLELIQPFIPEGWESVQRPTGGGIVFHDQDLCFSLVWKQGEAVLPSKLSDIYLWIHAIVQEALSPWMALRLASCNDCATPVSSFQERQCFEAPVAYDLLAGTEKIVGGAIARRRNGFLYQGTIHGKLDEAALTTLTETFERRFRV